MLLYRVSVSVHAPLRLSCSVAVCLGVCLLAPACLPACLPACPVDACSAVQLSACLPMVGWLAGLGCLVLRLSMTGTSLLIGLPPRCCVCSNPSDSKTVPATAHAQMPAVIFEHAQIVTAAEDSLLCMCCTLSLSSRVW